MIQSWIFTVLVICAHNLYRSEARIGGSGSHMGVRSLANDDSSSEERPRHHHSHYYSPPRKSVRYENQAATRVENKQNQESKQLQSSGGGFNANINQKNDFSPNFGNIGDIGSSITGREYTPDPDIVITPQDVEKFNTWYHNYNKQRRSHESLGRYPKRFSKPEYFFDFRQVFFPRGINLDLDDGSSSEEDN